MRRLFLSDLHLWDPESSVFGGFQELLSETCGQVDEIYLLGDICEVWVGDDDDGPLAQALVSVLARAAERARLFVMAGNRDFLFGERFAKESGVRLIPDPYLLNEGTLLAHGDTFCTDDVEYQQTRRVLRSADWQRDILARPLAERRALAEGMRAQSRATNANKADNIMDVCTRAVDHAAEEHGARVLVHGHTHRPGIHVHGWGRRYVLGAWERCGWRLEEEDGAFALVCFALPNRPGPASA